MATVPTNKMERELRKLYLQWVADLSVDSRDLPGKIDTFRKRSEALIARLGGQAASLGALAGFPVPKYLELSPHAGTVYDQMQQAVIQAGIMTGISSKEAAQTMFRAGMDKSYKRLERLARTETVSAYWKNSWDSIADLPALVMVWSSEDGPRTCEWCMSRDGLVVEDSNIRDHPNGRCTLIPVLRSQLKYRGTLQPDGSVDMDPRWKDQKVKGAKATDSAGPTTEEQRDPMNPKGNPAAPNVAQPVHQPKLAKAAVHKPAITPATPSPVKGAVALDNYRVNSFELNASLRAGKAADETVKALDGLIKASHLEEPTMVRRVLSGRAADDLLAAANKGAIYRDKAFMSTQKTSHGVTADAISDYANMGGTKVQMMFKVTEDMPALDVTAVLGDTASAFYDEGEVLLPRNMKLIPSKPRLGNDGIWYVLMKPT